MLQPGDNVVYGIHGVCCILDIEQRMVNKKKTQYYVLYPLDQPDSRFYIPVHNEIAVSKLKPMLNRDEFDALIKTLKSDSDAWIQDENQRKQHYRELISSGDRAALMHMLHALYAHKQEQLASGRKFHLCDENFMRDAEKLLASEFSMILQVSQTEVWDYIRNEMEK